MKKWVIWRYAFEMYLIGYWKHNGNFGITYQVKTFNQAAELVNYLNGGKGEPLPFEILCKFKPTKAMWIYTFNQETSFFVGYFLPNGNFEKITEVSTQRQAEALVNYLNGGTGESRTIIPDPEPEPEPIPE